VETCPIPSVFIWAELRFTPQYAYLESPFHCLWQGRCEMSKDELFRSPLKKPVIEMRFRCHEFGNINDWLCPKPKMSYLPHQNCRTITIMIRGF